MSKHSVSWSRCIYGIRNNRNTLLANGKESLSTGGNLRVMTWFLLIFTEAQEMFFFLLILFPSISDFVVSKARVCFMLEFASSIHDLAGMAAAGVAEEHNHILGYSYSFSISLMQVYLFILSPEGDFPQSRHL